MATNIKLPWITIVMCMFVYKAAVEGNMYQLMDDFDFSLEESDSLLFEVKSCATVQLLLMKNKSDFQTELYEVKIGKWNNSDSAIRKGSSGITSYSEQESLECDTTRAFWISLGDSSIHVGNGFVVGEDEFIAYNTSSQVKHVIKHVLVSPGYWIFYTSNCKCCYHKPRYCQGLQESGITESGVYTVTDVVSGSEVDIYCDMDTDGGGWLVFQRRMDGSEEFYRGWDDYENGFGNPAGEFWLGNHYLSAILSDGHYELRIDLKDFEGNKRYAQYQTFMIGTSLKNYKLTVCGYSGDAGDSFSGHSGMEFTTKDRDNDLKGYNCAEAFKGAWWYVKCLSSNLNGRYLWGNHSSYADGVNWIKWKGPTTP